MSFALLAASLSAGAASQIPLCPGLTIVTAVNQPSGDYESIKTIEAVAAKEIRLKYSSEAPDSDMLSPTAGKMVKTTVYRKLLADDLRSAPLYEQVYVEGSDELIPGTTAIGTSTSVLSSLKAKGEATLAVSNVVPGVPLKADRAVHPNAYDYFATGKLIRVGTVKMPVLVNDRRVDLSAIHARGDFMGDQHEFFFLDDDANPLALKFRLGIGAIKPMRADVAGMCAEARKLGPEALAGFEKLCMPSGGDRDLLQVIKITYRCTGPKLPEGGGADGGPGQVAEVGSASEGVSALEQALQKSGRADIYSIYFSFNSDAIREQSEPTLKEIGALMHKHPDWKLSINGHTDNIASDKYNLELSQRRAAAVTKALTTRHGIATNRLTYGGQGESSPKDTNATLEGRAKNRRVELVRLP